ncbi:pentapeptide repeat-containing protein [Streptomyces sp. NPDC058655]|uniref:pentapeptide repeat-containing protein n=1 Tax=Streptomyces sp. NPDC058655 TaxID=3346577 RepID=UPI00364C73AE
MEAFRSGASPTAQRLAAHLAAVPLTLPVMTLVRRSLLRESEHGHLAEVALGGLFAPWDGERDPEDVEFEFLPGVREALLGSQLRGDVAAVRELVRRRVWEFMSRNRGAGPDFSATRVAPGGNGRRPVPEGATAFAQGPPAPAPPQEPGPDPALGAGLRERLVRVRYEPLRGEAQEVGTLLTPRLVLTVGDARPGPNTVAWVRAGDREVLCHSVWWDDAFPRVFLLLAVRDLVDARTWPGPPYWAGRHDGPVRRVRVHGSTDQGEPVALTGEVAPYEGSRNGELVRLSAEPESWTHYRGAPVSRDGALLGVVHGVWPDRMVFLSGHALLEQPGFRAVLDTHTRMPPAGDPGGPLHLAVGVEAPGSADGRGGGRAVGPLVAESLRELMRHSGVAGQVIETSGTDLLVVVDAPGALGKAGRMLAGLPAMIREFDAAHPPGAALAVAVSGGEAGFEEAGFSGTAVAAAARRLGRDRSSRRPGSGPLLALSPPLQEELDRLLGPAALRRPPGWEDGPEGWFWTGDAGELGQAMAEADEIRDGGGQWPECGLRPAEGDLRPCIGIRLPGGRRCLAHAPDREREAHLAALRAGSPVDLRGTTFEGGLLRQVLEAVRLRGSRRPGFGPVAFDHARFVDDWSAGGAEFAGRASFTRAVFAGRAQFEEAAFDGRAVFDGAVFRNGALFDRSRFARGTAFRRAVFGGPAGFTDTAFLDGVSFARAVLEASADLNRMRADGPADFSRTVFRGLAGLSGATFAGPADFSYASWERGLVCAGAAFEGPVTFDHASFRGRVRLDGVRFPPGTDAGGLLALPGRWTGEHRPDHLWDIRLADPG